ncbi:MAG: hypothetical protein IJ137_10805 [Eubacterium sp.]|nr:hypothetical protein [Eubacterium sp.]
MKDNKAQEKDYNIMKRPKVQISTDNLDLEIEEGKVYRGSFVVSSENQVPVNGYVYSTNDKIGIEQPKISGLKQEIVYYFKGKLATAGSEFEGDFAILTNGGEFNIPYRIRVVKNCASTSMGLIRDMTEFADLYRKNPQEARELFFLPNFAEVFLKGEPEQKAMYHSLMKSRSRQLILEEFLTASGYKEMTELVTEEEGITLAAGTDSASLQLTLSEPGYIEGRIYSEKKQVRLSADRFNSEDFQDGKFVLEIRRNRIPAIGNDIIHISTIRQDILIPVDWWGAGDVEKREREKEFRVKRQKAELMHNYLYFRTGSIGFEDFSQESHLVLDDLIFLTGDMKWKLYLTHLLLMEESADEAKDLLNELIEYDRQTPFSPLGAHYLLYLKAMANRTPEAIGEAVTAIRRFYENSDRKAEALWMLIYLDREYVYNKRLQYDTIKQLFQAGNNSCLLYFEACEILNENPNYMEEAGPFEISVFRWGVRYGFVSMSLAYQFARLALKLKFYSRSIFYIAEKLYKVEPDELFLQVICSLLIKGNRVGKEYHEYFYHAVLSNLKIVGLNEFFIRSMDFSQYEEIPQRVLIYFTYSNSLDSLEKAYLYTNILKNKEAYAEVYGAYYSKMVPFVEEQLLKGRMNEHLAFLYTFFQKEILLKPENAKAVCDVLFYRRIICRNPHMIGVYIVSPETGEETYVPLSGGSCYVKIINNRTVIYFVDSAEQRYVKGIAYELNPFLTLSQLPEEWIYKNIANKMILQTLSDKVDEPVTRNVLPVLQRIAFNQDYQPYMRRRALEKLLVYYENHQEKKELARWLEKTDYSNISPSFRKTLMDYYMEVGMIEHAYFGIELYGSSIMGAAKRLRLASFGVSYYDGKMDETTLSLAYTAFVNKKYNRDTLSYLMNHFDGELIDLLTIWERAGKFQLPTTDFEKKILTQSIFTGSNTEDVFPVFESFYQNASSDSLVGDYLEYISDRELTGDLVLSDRIHQIIGEEIVKGKIRDKRTKIRFLYYFAEKKDWHERVHGTVETIVDEFLLEEFYLPVYQVYADWLTFPTDYSERTFLTYHGSPGKSVCLYYEIDGEKGEARERHLLEILPGMYVTSLHFYQDDHVNYRMEADGEPVKNEEDIHFETFEYEGEDSRFFELNYLEEKVEEADGLDEYLLKSFFTDQFMTIL